jgi:phosphopantothenoylcysteine decarboxylase/phosphopantothenate--cysteine ligase
MGYRLAEAARDRGAEVVLVSGPTSLPAPRDVELVAVRSAEQMARAVDEHYARATVVVGAAAVADYRPAEVATAKLKKGEGPLELALVRTEDILAGLGKKKGSRVLVGFAAETEDLVARARAKLEAKGLDLIVANEVAAGFGGETNQAVLVRPQGEPTELPRTSKRELADRICDEIVALRSGRRVGPPVETGAGRR